MPGTSSTLPYSTDANKTGFRLQLVDPNDANAMGPMCACRGTTTVDGGLLDGWNYDAAKALKRPTEVLDGWDQAVWNDDDKHFLEQLPTLTSPDEVAAAMPRKWQPNENSADGDTALLRVCELCTALVNRFVEYEEGGVTAPTTTAQWREHERLGDLLRDVQRVLEGAMGESIAITALADPGFVRSVWPTLVESDQHAVQAILDHAPHS